MTCSYVKFSLKILCIKNRIVGFSDIQRENWVKDNLSVIKGTQAPSRKSLAEPSYLA